MVVVESQIGVSMTVTDSNIINNTETSGNGGGIDNWGTISLNDTNLYGNTANGYGYGGGIENDQGSMNINCSNIYLNLATFGGGGIDVSEGSGYGIVTINNSNIYSNTAYTTGGGLNNNLDGVMIINNSKIYGNIATRSSTSAGGGVYNLGGAMGITGTNIYSNSAIWGGGIDNNNGIYTLDDSNIYLNSAQIYGGGILNDEFDYTCYIIDSSIYNNTAIWGGGIDNDYGNLELINSNIYNNTATLNGGGVYNQKDGNLNISDSNITNNTSQLGPGSAIYNMGISTVNFNRIIGTGTVIANQGGTVDATNNWWGSNSNPSGEVSSNVNVSTWLVLNTNASPNRITPGGASNITADLTHDQNGVYYDPINGHVPDGIPVTFTSTLGTLNPTSALTVNGIVTSVYTGSMVTGTDTIKSVVDSQLVNTQINISNPEADVALSQTGNYSVTM